MSFLCVKESSFAEIEPRTKNRERLLSFGIDYLDDSMLGIMPNDLILIGAYSGAGKTAICCNIAAANIAKGKRVHYIALEAEIYEIERRIKYQFFANFFFKDPERPKIDINFQNWMMGDYFESCKLYEAQAQKEMEEKFSTLFVLYKQNKFDVQDLIFTVTSFSDETDLIIVDHIHYFDYDDDKENRAIKEIAKTARMLTLEQGKPMILVSHLRKRDRTTDDICPGIEEFHGSSDLYKIATKAVTLGPGDSDTAGQIDTYFRVVKNRFDGSVTRFIGKAAYLQKEGKYEKGYQIGKSNQKRDDGFTAIDSFVQPSWCRNSSRPSSDSATMVKKQSLPNFAPRGPYFVAPSQKES